jgi:DNA mismatch repair ATPase MutS
VYSPGTFGLFDENFEDTVDGTTAPTTTAFLALHEHPHTSGLLGVCCVDVTTGVLSLGVWQEVDVERSVLEGIVESFGVREIVVADAGVLSVDTRRAVKRIWVSVERGAMEAKCEVKYVRQEVSGNVVNGHRDEARKLVAESGCLFGTGTYNEVGLEAVAVALRFMWDTKVAFGMASRMCVQGMHVVDLVDVPRSDAAMTTRETRPERQSTSSRNMFMVLNGKSLKNLDVFHGASLHRFLSGYACTMMGRRAIRRWLSKPLINVNDIECRLDVVDTFSSMGSTDYRMLHDGLLKLHDVEKKMPVIAQQLSILHLEDANNSLMLLAGGIAPSIRRDAISQERVVTWGQVKSFSCVIHDVLFFAKEYVTWFSKMPTTSAENPVLHRIHENAVAAHDVCLPIAGSFPLVSSSSQRDLDPLLLPSGVWPVVDQCHAAVLGYEAELALHGQHLVGMIVNACRAGRNTSNATLRKVRIAGTDEAIRITCPISLETSISRELPQWIPRERSRNMVLYTEVWLTELSTKLAEARRAYNLAVNRAISVLFNLFLDEYGSIIRFCRSIGELDALLAFAKLANDGRMPSGMKLSRPRFEDDAANRTKCPRLFLRDAWNPQLLTHKKFSELVLNTISVGGTSPAAFLVSGANSGGKTNILKTTAIATIMAQIGCYIPCADSRITPVSKILTRLGACDRLAAGESTFAIEMKETSAILGQVDVNSLAIIDEIGRGTCPGEGRAIAWATLNELASRCRTMLATHYHELNDEFEFDPRVAKFHMPIATAKGKFQLRAGPEPNLSSGGVPCAADAGVPHNVLKRASHVSEMVKRQLRQAFPSLERRLAKASLEMLRAGRIYHGISVAGHLVPSLQSLQSLQRQVAFLLDEDDD